MVEGEGDTYEEALADVNSAITFHVDTFGANVVAGCERSSPFVVTASACTSLPHSALELRRRRPISRMLCSTTFGRTGQDTTTNRESNERLHSLNPCARAQTKVGAQHCRTPTARPYRNGAVEAGLFALGRRREAGMVQVALQQFQVLDPVVALDSIAVTDDARYRPPGGMVVRR